MKKLIAPIALTLLASLLASLPASSQKSSAYEKLSESGGSITFFQKNTAEVVNKRSKVIRYTIVIAFTTRDAVIDAAYVTTGYEANCTTGIITQTSEGIYNSKHGLIKGDIQRKESTASDDSDYGKLRDRLCKKFGF